MWFHLYEILERTVESLASESKVSRRGSGTEGQEDGFAKQREEALGAAGARHLGAAGGLTGSGEGLEGDRSKHSQEPCRGSGCASPKSSLAPSLLSSRLCAPLLARFRIIHLKMEEQER